METSTTIISLCDVIKDVSTSLVPFLKWNHFEIAPTKTTHQLDDRTLICQFYAGQSIVVLSVSRVCTRLCLRLSYADNLGTKNLSLEL